MKPILSTLRTIVCTCVCLFFFLATPRGMQDLNSPTRDQTVSPALEAQILVTGSPGKSPCTFPMKDFYFEFVLLQNYNANFCFWKLYT